VLVLIGSRSSDFLTNDVIITDAIRFVQSSKEKLKSSEKEEEETGEISKQQGKVITTTNQVF